MIAHSVARNPFIDKDVARVSEGTSCPVCGSTETASFFAMADVPVHVGIQWPTREAARGCPRADIDLCWCRACTFVFNRLFDPARLRYSQAYENPLYFSPRFRQYSHAIASRLVDRYDVRNKDVIEIGCGKGDFLSLVCRLGDNRGIGFDPSFEGDRSDFGDARRFTVVKDFYSDRYADHQGDLICARHVFEHILDPVDFLSMIRRTIGDRKDVIVFMEVPNVLFILRDLSVWDIIYEHCSYFGPRSLARVLRRCGFTVRDVRTEYGGQFLTVEGEVNGGEDGPRPAEGESIEPYVPSFADNCRATLQRWKGNLDALVQDGRRIVLWGAGAKAVGFLNMLGVDDQIEYVVDINPHKHGAHIAGTGQEIVPPAFLKRCRPDTVIVANPIYRREVKDTLDRLKVETDLIDAWVTGDLQLHER
jgi:SAM-dependent methyltransferase